MVKSCGLCGLQAADDTTFREHMIAVHAWGATPARAKEIRGVSPKHWMWLWAAVMVTVVMLGLFGVIPWEGLLE